MPSTREYLDFVLEQLSDLDGIAYWKMMGEDILYYRGRIVYKVDAAHAGHFFYILPQGIGVQVAGACFFFDPH